MKSVGVREFGDHATTCRSGGEPVGVSEHGQVIGIFFPMKRDHERVKRALDKLGETVQEILEETAMTEDELVEFLDPRRPLPD